MGVIEGERGGVLVVVDERRIQRAAAKHPRPHEVPQRRADHVGIGEAVGEVAHGGDQAAMLFRLDDEEKERQHFEEGEDAARRDPDRRLTHPVPMMAGPDHPAQEDEEGFEQHGAEGEPARHQPHRHEEIGGDHGGKELEGLLDPEMDHPPAPVIGEGEGDARALERDHAEPVEHRDIDRACPEQVLERDPSGPELAGGDAERRPVGPEGAEDHVAPEGEADGEADLPGPAELEIGEPLIADPEPGAVDHPHDPEIVAEQRAADDEDGDGEEEVDQSRLALRLTPGDERSEEEGGGDPGKPDPDDRRLEVDRAERVEGEDVVEDEAVEIAALGIVVGHDAARADLHEEHQRHHQEIDADCPLAR